MKRFLISLWACTLALSPFTTFAFEDIPKNSELETHTQILIDAKVIQSGRLFRPELGITRGQAISQALKAAQTPLLNTQTSSFSDVNNRYKYFSEIETAFQNGIVKGIPSSAGKQTFFPHQNLTRAEAIKILILSFELQKVDSSCVTETFSDVQPADWYSEFAQKALFFQLVPNNNIFAPYEKITRQEWVGMLTTAMNPAESLCNEFKEEKTPTKAPIEETTDENLSEKSDTLPRETLLENNRLLVEIDSERAYEKLGIPENGIVTILPLHLTAKNATVYVKSITIEQSGLADIKSIDDVWATNTDGRPLSPDSSFKSNKKSLIEFPGKGLEIFQGNTSYVDIKASFQNADPNQSFRFTVTEVLFDTLLDTADPSNSGVEFTL